MDLKFRIGPQTSPSGKIEIIGIDKKTITSFGGNVDLQSHLSLLKSLKKHNPQAILYLKNVTELKANKKLKEKFSKEVAEFENFILGLEITPLKGEIENFRPKTPFEKIPYFPIYYTIDTTTWAEDDVSRRTLLWYQDYQYAFPYLAEKVTGKKWNEYRGIFDQLTSKQLHTDFRRPGTYKVWSMVDVINDKVEKDLFKDKIVLVDVITTEIKDNLKTPYTRNRYDTSKLEVHANSLDTLITDSAILHSPKWVNLLLTMIVAILTLFIVLNMRPTKGILALGGLFFGFFFISYLFFAIFRIHIETAHPLIVVFLSYYFFIPYRLIKEARSSWEYQQKNRLLQQVEELKSNFLSMMSHDLKTPLARIQGMAEIALEDPDRLSEQQEGAIASIRSSTQELTELVTSILDLNRIESQNIKLNLQSKDPNSIVTDVVKRCSPHAKVKGISVITELEPLFSIKMDSDLIRQVVSNLVENAIKYSPDNTKILVISEERENQVIIQVSDQGIGIKGADIKNIFMKFYRSKDAKSSPIKGSGLGLYLAKYFVELHKGRLTVDSVLGQGSTFTVHLPTDL